MRINHKGMDKDFYYRMAEISFDEDTEQRLMDKIEQIMRIKGYDLCQVAGGYASCEVDNKDEYNQFVRDYKECKKSAKLQLKHGI